MTAGTIVREFLQIKNNKDQVYDDDAQEATSMSLIAVISPEDSWMTQMAEDKSFLQRNIHNISVPGRLPNATTQDLKNQRIRYRSKGFFFKGELYFQLPDIL